jgi:hypothetical protein
VVRIGVVGHRPNRLAPDVSARLHNQCKQVIATVRSLAAATQDRLVYAPGPPLIRIISSLAEGADRIGATAGIDSGCELQSPLPFSAAEFERDFQTPASRAEFHQLLSQASAVLELDGQRSEEGAAYESAARIVIDQSDILIAIWDGEPEAGKGGTAQSVREALRSSLPVIWIHACREVAPCLLLATQQDSFATQPIESLQSHFAHSYGAVLAGSDGRWNFAHAYYAEHQPRFDGGQFFRSFRDFVANGRLSHLSLRIPDFQSSCRANWEAAMEPIHELPEKTRAFILDQLNPHYAWADGLSTYYAGCFRSSYLATNLLAASAVMSAVLGHILSDRHPKGAHYGHYGTVIELLLITAILVITFCGRRGRWHERWLNYRQLAEQLRQISFLGPLSSMIHSPHQPAHFGSDPHQPFVDLVLRAIVRDLGLAQGMTDHRYLKAIGAWLGKVVSDQASYHESNADTMERLDHNLHRAGTGLFVLTSLACLMHLVLPEPFSDWLLFGAVVFPAFGAAFYAISNQNEFARIAKSSHAMKRELEALLKEAIPAALVEDEVSLSLLRAVAERAANIMVSETLDWHFVFSFRSLNLPG